MTSRQTLMAIILAFVALMLLGCQDGRTMTLIEQQQPASDVCMVLAVASIDGSRAFQHPEVPPEVEIEPMPDEPMADVVPPPKPQAEPKPMPRPLQFDPFAGVPKGPRIRCLVFTMTDCESCNLIKKRINEEMVPVGWKAGDGEGVDFLYCDKGEFPALVDLFKIEGYPTLIVVNGTAEVERHVGTKTADDLARWLNVHRN